MKSTMDDFASSPHSRTLAVKPERTCSRKKRGEDLTRTLCPDYAGTETVEQDAAEVVRVAFLGPDTLIGKFTRWEGETIPW